MRRRFFLFLAISSSIFADQRIVVDPDFSPYAAADDFLFAHSALRKTYDHFHSNKDRDPTLRVWIRAIEQIGFWYPINLVSDITQHEVFGHGYRIRELDQSVEGYEITLLGGSTSFKVEETFPVGKMQAITVAGLEAEAVLALKTKAHWIRDHEIDGRLSTLYTAAQESIFWYTLITKLGEIESPSPFSGNDVESYLATLNLSYPDELLTIGDLTQWASFSWLDPMTYYAYFSWFYYIATACPWHFPMFQLTDCVEYLPNVRIGYAPYAPEAYFESFFRIDGEPLYLYIKGGKRSAGIGAFYERAYCSDRGTLGFNLDLWWQKQYITSATVEDLDMGRSLVRSELNDNVWGVAASVTGTLNLFNWGGIYAELGGKTNGYLPGYQLGPGIVARVGLNFRM